MVINIASKQTKSSITSRISAVPNCQQPVMPPFVIDAADTSVCVTINVKHITPENFICQQHYTENSCQIVFNILIGAIEYCLCLSLHSQSMAVSRNPVIDFWENNVTVQFELDFRTACDKVECEIFAGCDWSSLEKVIVPGLLEHLSINQKKLHLDSQPLTQIPENHVNDSKPTADKPFLMDTEESPEPSLSDELEENECRPTARSSEKFVLRSSRSYSESSDDGSLSTTPNRGILKKRFSARSLSESSVDDFSFRHSLQDVSSYAIAESFRDDEMFGSVDRSKKTVRFNDVVKEQVFRTNSSIFGQRKKNQRKSQHKKRKLSQSSSIESIDGDTAAESIAEKVDEEPEIPVEEANDSSAENNHTDSGIEFDGHDTPVDAKKGNKKSKKKRSKAKKQKSDISDLMFAMEI